MAEPGNFDPADRNLNTTPETPGAERPLEPTEARQGFRGKPVLIVLLAGLVLALVAWIPAEWWGQKIAPSTDPATETTRPTTAPQQPSQPSTTP
ncbi:hypothetical protein HGO34_06345 [Agrobacterium vitis]|uniref:Uncharacterized protein n=1 Tax=Agrobacterium vitis TaxID=373 RepID=A0AAE5AVU4_AGRVI|nr:hypothetical protein [Agrobacterium vitis]MCF1499408.1 hypothetical protein [Allorhizobium sp. Av2]MCM2439340.1 hypothetical protein [Agrobacterium vitis]MUZ57756.1 hypothetical protein [Agrobacterium vitis]MVA67844.1 hypothetical protein [Agrobacterium vitis]MVA87745.1 hypothetical protein [Agrobacterium vitis]